MWSGCPPPAPSVSRMAALNKNKKGGRAHYYFRRAPTPSTGGAHFFPPSGADSVFFAKVLGEPVCFELARGAACASASLVSADGRAVPAQVPGPTLSSYGSQPVMALEQS